MTRPATIPTTVAELADAAAARIETHGWHTGGMYNRDHGDPFTAPACADAALWLSMGLIPGRAYKTGTWKDRRALLVRATEEAIERLPQLGGRPIPTWNDTRGRTAEQVVAALRTVARAA